MCVYIYKNFKRTNTKKINSRLFNYDHFNLKESRTPSIFNIFRYKVYIVYSSFSELHIAHKKKLIIEVMQCGDLKKEVKPESPPPEKPKES